MRQLQIQAAEEGQRLDKYLSRYMPEAPKSFFYKMLRKKNITCNKKKCDGSEKLCAGDCIELFLAEDTIEKFRGNTDEKKASSIQTQTQNVSLSPKSIIYEDDDILLINKAAGELSQKASPKDVSMVEKVIGYALSTQKVTNEQLLVCRPSVCNRLDRNTSGLIAAGFSIRGLQFLSEQFRTRDLHKYYMALVAGCVTRQQKLKGYLYKDEKTYYYLNSVSRFYLYWEETDQRFYMEKQLYTQSTWMTAYAEPACTTRLLYYFDGNKWVLSE